MTVVQERVFEMYDLLDALRKRYKDIYLTDLSPDQRLLSFMEPIDRRCRESVVYIFHVVDEKNFEIVLNFNSRYPLNIPQTELYLNKLSDQLSQDNIIVESGVNNSITLRSPLTLENLSYEEDPQEQADMVDNIAVNLANIIHSMRGVVHINYRLKDKMDSERSKKLQPQMLVELTLCSWKPNSSVQMC